MGHPPPSKKSDPTPPRDPRASSRFSLPGRKTQGMVTVPACLLMPRAVEFPLMRRDTFAGHFSVGMCVHVRPRGAHRPGTSRRSKNRTPPKLSAARTWAGPPRAVHEPRMRLLCDRSRGPAASFLSRRNDTTGRHDDALCQTRPTAGPLSGDRAAFQLRPWAAQ